MTSIVAWHGFMGSKEDFSLLSEQSSFSIEAFDLVGHGEARNPSSVEQFHLSKQLDYWKEHLPIDRILLGYSMGGRLALQFACRYPERLKGLILIGATPGIEEEELRLKRREWDHKMAEILEREGMASFYSLWQSLPIIQSQQNIEASFLAQMRQRRLHQDSTSLAQSLRYFGTGTMEPCWKQLKNINIPVLFLAGEYDRKYCDIGYRIKEYLPESSVGIIPDAGHCCHLEQAKRSLMEIESWIRTIR